MIRLEVVVSLMTECHQLFIVKIGMYISARAIFVPYVYIYYAC